MLPERFTVGLTPLPTAARVARKRSALRLRIISAVISLVLLIGILFFLDPGWSTGLVVAFVVVWVVSTGIWMAVTVVGLHRAKRDLASIGHGDAFHIDAEGIEFVHPEPVRAPWSDIASLRITGNSLGSGPSLVMETAGGRRVSIPLSFVDASPSAIDSATSARSLGRVRVDVSAMEAML